MTDHVGRAGIPSSSVSTPTLRVELGEREELSLAQRILSKTRRHPRVVLSIVGSYRRSFLNSETLMAPNVRTVAKAIQHFLPSKLPPTLSDSPSSLYQVLSRFPKDGVGRKVYQTRWGTKGFPHCYWEVTRTKLKLEGKHGKAWGRLFWKGTSVRVVVASDLAVEVLMIGKRVGDETLIRGGLKYTWAPGTSTAGIPKSKPPSNSSNSEVA